MNHLAYKTKLKLNNQQKTLMGQCGGYSRWVWNWALDFKQKAYGEDIKLNKSQLRKYYTNYVKPNYSWQSDLSSKIYQYAFVNLDNAYKRFFKGLAKYPRFKKKGKSTNSFTLDASGKPIVLGGKYHKLPFFSWLKTHEKLPICRTKKVTFSEQAGDWYISFLIEVDFLPVEKTREKVGVDVGISKLATLSCGKVFENPKAYYKAQNWLTRLQRDLSRKVFHSSNWYKARLKVQKAHRRVANIRSNAIHHLTGYLAKNHSEVILEDLNVKGMVKNRRLSKALSDASLGMIREQIVYKCSWYDTVLQIADRFFPSSQLCSECGHRQKMPLSQRIYRCGSCNSRKDRDFNASLNLENYEALAAGSVALRSVDKEVPSPLDESDGKHRSDVQLCTTLS